MYYRTLYLITLIVIRYTKYYLDYLLMIKCSKIYRGQLNKKINVILVFGKEHYYRRNINALKYNVKSTKCEIEMVCK